MKAKTKNQINPCAKVVSEIMKTCFLINEETDFDAHFLWSGHVNNLDLVITPKNSSREHAVIRFEEYLNTPSKYDWGSELGTETYASFKKLSADLKEFYEKHMGR